ncbi:hypothetical protein [Rubritalea tangerina]|uniref:hypothetical protein n=1 Tax=Rubritalea tangerina TaxID=430798 RepID=UPI0036217883
MSSGRPWLASWRTRYLGKHSLFEESLHAPLIINRPNTTKEINNSITETVDIFQPSAK